MGIDCASQYNFTTSKFVAMHKYTTGRIICKIQSWHVPCFFQTIIFFVKTQGYKLAHTPTVLSKSQAKWEMKIFDPASNFACS